MEIKGKVAIVTGASGGIGLATAKLLAKNGAKVALVARNGEKLKTISKEIPGSIFVVANMTKKEDIRIMIFEVYKHFGKIDILVNNAGQGYDASIEETNIDTFRQIFELDVIGPMIAMQEVIPIMKKGKGGNIINVSSGTALIILPNMGAYSAAKRAMAQISLTAAEELKKDNIKVGVIYPYITLTDFEKNTIKEEERPEWSPKGDSDFKPPDAPIVVAEKILEGIKSGAVEIFVHDWMKKM
jgi:short-subunit dehydrogenase